jgi:ferrous iron transport protein A
LCIHFSVAIMTTLDKAVQGQAYWIAGVLPSPELPERARQLKELGFFQGEEVVLMRRTQPGSDPLVVRIGLSTFALRRAEAACVLVEAVHPVMAVQVREAVHA